MVTVFIIVTFNVFSKNQIAGLPRGDRSYCQKSGTPIMGGIIIIIGMISTTLLWADLKNIYVWTLIFVSLSLGLLGFLDDLLKIKYENSIGLNSKLKFLGQLIISLVTVFVLIKFSGHQYLYNLYFPFFKNFIVYMGIFFIPFALFVIIGSSISLNEVLNLLIL